MVYIRHEPSTVAQRIFVRYIILDQLHVGGIVRSGTVGVVMGGGSGDNCNDNT